MTRLRQVWKRMMMPSWRRQEERRSVVALDDVVADVEGVGRKDKITVVLGSSAEDVAHALAAVETVAVEKDMAAVDAVDTTKTVAAK
jgi:hypothetical protein